MTDPSTRHVIEGSCDVHPFARSDACLCLQAK
jgi:hypothetical protein